MKKTQFIELLANIKATLVSFLSIVMFVLLGVGLFLGIRGAALSLAEAAQLAFEQDHFRNFDVTFPYGLSEDDLKALNDIKGIDQVVPCYFSYEQQEIEGARHVLVVHSITEGVDECALVEGAMPAKVGEVAVSEGYAEAYDLKVGKAIKLVHNAEDEADKDGMQYLTTGDFTVTGIVTNASYLAQDNLMLGMTDTGDSIQGFVYVTQDCFDPAAYLDLYPRAVVRSNELSALDTFSDEYHAKSAQLKDAIVEVGEPRAQARYDHLKSEADKQVAEAEQQIEEGETKLEEANTQIAEGEVAIASGRQQLDAAIAQLERGQASYEEARARTDAMLATLRENVARIEDSYNQAKAQLDERREQFNRIKTQVNKLIEHHNAFKAELEGYINEINEIAKKRDNGEITSEEYLAQTNPIAAKANAAIDAEMQFILDQAPAVSERFPNILDLMPLKLTPDNTMTVAAYLLVYDGYINTAKTMIDTAQEQLDQAQAQFDSFAAQLGSAQEQLATAETDASSALDQALAELQRNRDQIEEGEKTLTQKTTELEEGKNTVKEKTVELEEGKEKLAKAKEQAGAMMFMSWIVTDRMTASGSIALTNIINLTNNLRIVMASLFVVVGLLVCYSALSRIVHEQVTQIGTKKAVGFRAGEITSSYMAYTILAVILGVGLGIVCSTLVVQGILYPKLASSFDMPRVGPNINLADTVLIAAIEMVLLLACTWFACHSILKKNAVVLLQGEQSGNGTERFYERWSIWKRLPLLTQTVINNCMSDSRRVFATLIGVAGCTALIVTASSLDGNITRSLTEHFGTIYEFDATVGFDPDNEDAATQVAKVLEDNKCLYTPVRSSMFLIEDEGEPAYEYVIIPEDDETFAELFHLNVVPTDGAAHTQGCWVSQSHADHRGLHVGDPLTICTVAGERYQLRIAGFFTYYLPNNMIVMSPSYYRDVMGEEAAPNAYLTALAEDAKADEGKALISKLSKTKGFTSFKDERKNVATIITMFKGVTSTVVGIYIALSALMAIIVLLNLDYMFINEKKRELIVLMINGYSVSDAKGYIYRDAIVMTVLGIVFGVGLGIVMGSATVGAVEWQSCSFMKDVYLPGCLMGAGMSAVFAALMMIIALRRIPRFSLTDIARF